MILRATVQLVFVFTVSLSIYHTVNPSSVVPTAVYHIIMADNERSNKINLLYILAMHNDFHAYCHCLKYDSLLSSITAVNAVTH